MDQYLYKNEPVVFTFFIRTKDRINYQILSVERFDWYSRFQNCIPKFAKVSAMFCVCGANEYAKKSDLNI